MAKGYIVYNNASGTEETYNFPVNITWKFPDWPKPENSTIKTLDGVILSDTLYTARVIRGTFKRISTVQYEKLQEIGGLNGGMCTFYPYGADGNGYYGQVKFSGDRVIYTDVNQVTMTFVQSRDQAVSYNNVSVKITNNDNIEYSGYLWVFEINTLNLISQGKLDVAGTYLRVHDENGFQLQYWYQPDTWNTTKTLFFVKIGTFPANTFKFIQIVLDSVSTDNPGPDTSIFDYYDDFESTSTYTTGDIDGQGGWTATIRDYGIQGNATAEIITVDNLRGVELDGFDQNPSDFEAIHRDYTSTGNNILLMNYKITDHGVSQYSTLQFGFVDDSIGEMAPNNGYTGQLRWDYDENPDEFTGRIIKWTTGSSEFIDSGAEDFDDYINLYKTSMFMWHGDDFKLVSNQGNFDDHIAENDSDHQSFSKLYIRASGRMRVFINFLAVGKVPKQEPTIVVSGDS